MTRPEHLPDFKFPPLQEVVLGVQFSSPKTYQQIYAGEVWNLFREKYPKVEEHPPLTPMFEIFGLPQSGQFNFGITTGVSHDRFWFLSETEEELIQFQSGRLLHNWRKVENKTNEYPRFEKMIKDYKNELLVLEKYFSNFSMKHLSINQCEITYINHIPIIEENKGLYAQGWLRFIDLSDIHVDDFSTTFRRIIKNKHDNPIARLTCEAKTAINRNGEKIIVLSLTMRGAPADQSISSSVEFMTLGRETIVNCFDEVTTEEAHKKWGKIK